MGSSSSKAARGAARKFPTRAPQAVPPQASKQPVKPTQPNVGLNSDGTFPTYCLFHSSTHYSEAQNLEASDHDAVTGDFSRRLQEMGIVQPNPTFSPSSTAGPAIPNGPTAPLGPLFPPARSNATLSVLESRRHIQQQAEDEVESLGLGTSQGRRFVDMRTMVEAIQLRGQGYATIDIEKKLRLQPGLLAKLGPPGLVSHAA
ncbi:hypothetical protein HJFPF1_01379 [Paramyrothecium foliicola]|nr:hypothetical protein HJFPF1_01379 [Paramyrothecium foliicola]